MLAVVLLLLVVRPHYLCGLLASYATHEIKVDSPQAPQVEARPASWEVGDVLMNEEFVHEFEITARENARITAALTTCACLTLELSSESLTAGASVRLKGRLRTSGLIGVHEKAFHLILDDKQTLIIPVRFNVWSGAPPKAGERPALTLEYPRDAADRHDVLAAAVRVASIRQWTYVVRAGGGYVLEAREERLEGRDTVLAWLDREVPPERPPREPPVVVPGVKRIEIRYYYWPTCTRCLRVVQDLLPELERRHGGRVTYRRLELSNVDHLASYLGECRRAGVKPAASAAFVGRHVLFDEDVERRLESTLALVGAEDELPVAPPDRGLVEHEFAQLGLVVILLAGLADGINPCAFATLVFLISFLRVTVRTRSTLFGIGMVYAAASFVTYLLLGLGALAALRAMSGFATVAWVVAVGVALGSMVLGVLSLVDAVRFSRSGRADAVLVQLPTAAKRQIHSVLRRRLRGGGLLLGGFLSGALVTLLEAACTGQIYLPTLVAMTRDPSGSTRAWTYLLLYNVAFIIPLIVVVVAAGLGLSQEWLVTFARKRVVLLKGIASIVFFGLGAVLLYVTLR